MFNLLCVSADLCLPGTASTGREAFLTAGRERRALLPKAGISAAQSVESHQHGEASRKGHRRTWDADGQAACTHLSRVQRTDVLSLHDEHVDEVDEDARGLVGLSRTECKPLVENHEDQVAKETKQEEKLRKKQQVDVKFLFKVPEKRTEKWEFIQIIKKSKIMFFNKYVEGLRANFMNLLFLGNTIFYNLRLLNEVISFSHNLQKNPPSCTKR